MIGMKFAKYIFSNNRQAFILGRRVDVATAARGRKMVIFAWGLLQ